MVTPLPSGTLTLLFTDIEGSSGLWDSHRDPMRRALQLHHDILRDVIARHDGVIVKDKGDGFFVVFEDPAAAVSAAVEAQRGLDAAAWPEEVGQIRVRMALHTGTLVADGDDYHGPAVNRVARLESLAHGGQVVMSEATTALTRHRMPPGVELRDLGSHRLRGLDRPERVHQLLVSDLASEFKPLRSQTRTAPLPRFTTSFVGRSREIDEIAGCLGQHRLVTVLGPGGIGKTRLAVEAAERFGASLDREPIWVDLVPVSSPDEVEDAVAAAVGVHPEGTASVTALVAAALTEPTLVVIDNFEHVQPAARKLGELIALSPELVVLATSRSPLRLSAEKLYPIEPLDVSRGGEATEMFYARAEQLGVAIARTGPAAEAVADICAHLDGLPLAIELVAARTRLMGVEELRELVTSSLDVLGGGSLDLPERQRTIRATIDWSLQTLSASPQRLFRELSVFPAGATMAQLSDVASSFDFEDLAALVDNSLARAVTGEPGGTRYRQLVPLREYAAELLRNDDLEGETMARLVDHYLRIAPSLGRRLQTEGSTEREVRADHANMAWAMRWTIDHGRAAEMAAAQCELWVYWFNGDLAARAAQWVGAIDPAVDSPHVDWLAGFFAFQSGDYETAASRMARAQRTFAEHGDPYWMHMAGTFVGMLDEDVAAGEAALEATAQFFRQTDAGVDRFLPELFLSVRKVQLGNVDAALALRRDLLAWAESVQYDVLIAWAQWNLGLALLADGQVDEALEHGAKMLDVMLDTGYQEGIASGLELVAIAAGRLGRPESAVRVIGGSTRIFESIGTVRWPEMTHHVDALLGAVKEEMGEAAVERLLREGRQLALPELLDEVRLRAASG